MCTGVLAGPDTLCTGVLARPDIRGWLAVSYSQGGCIKHNQCWSHRQEEPLLLRTFRCHFGAVSGVPASLALGCIDVRHAWAKLLASTTSCIKLAIDIGPGVQSAESASHDLVQK